ncbi:hypothetical protein [Pedobacter gandavensis]|uniref:hypothetical protein n=1 Tax=Pedobacter gandavensis TaxID=2679963 RepID=UPI0029304E93|nr:hypothetical protein [Pedobacter gandavensis]
MATLSQAQAQAEFESRLSSLGTSPDDLVFEESELTAVEKVLGNFIEKIHISIEEEGLNGGGTINDIRIESTGNEVVVTAPKHLVFQDMGVQGAVIKQYPDSHFSYMEKRPPVDVFLAWIKAKNIQLRNNATYGGEESKFKDLTEEEQQLQVAWAISTKIYREGFKPRHIYSKHIDSLISDLENEITGFAIQQLVQNINIKPQANQVRR